MHAYPTALHDAHVPDPFVVSLDRGACSVGAGQVIKGLDDGLLDMKPGGIRRLYIPGDMAFPKGLKAAPGR